ncbi:hypothetical protein FE810_02850 [Thalassotalea litorea]|uniref:Uncharacterized protein n=1 Tax=Thalassotalea litorea TaxID=2020715 RepID=A0A5R9IZ88_9GAMM|nr:DUF6210 family protein [Thalassotalea litorea]TLU67238.1 hypothetical protein FE810_02850 [Thalassotalea litorea]
MRKLNLWGLSGAALIVPETTAIHVDSSKISDSYEAWVHVIVEENNFSDFSGFGEFKGVLTWCNSD